MILPFPPDIHNIINPKPFAKILRECSPDTMCHASRVTCHISHVMCHLSPVTYYVSHITWHQYSQTVRARDLTFWDNVHHPMRVICHMSCVNWLMSHLTSHIGLVPKKNMYIFSCADKFLDLRRLITNIFCNLTAAFSTIKKFHIFSFHWIGP